jgi:hypothetical protein
MKRAGHVLSKRRMHTGLWVNVLKEINNLEYLGPEWSIILKWVLTKWCGKILVNSPGSCKCGNILGVP